MRKGATMPDLDATLETICDPNATPELVGNARKAVMTVLGPAAEPLLRLCGRLAVTQREAAAMREELDRLVNGPQLRGIVTGVIDGRVRVLVGGVERLLKRPLELTIGIGQTVHTDVDGRTLLAPGEYLVGGQTWVFCERLEGRYALVRPLRDGAHDQARHMALVAEAIDLEALAPDDRVLGWLVDSGNLVLVTRCLGAARTTVPGDAGVGHEVARADLVGLDHIFELTDRLFLNATLPAYAALLEKVDPALVGVVYHGPTGTAKSSVARHYVSAVRRRGGRALYRTASNYLSHWVGDGSAALRADFEVLDAAYAETGVRSLLVIDELEAIALDRHHPAALHGGFLDVLDTLLSYLTRTHTRMIGITNVGDRLLEQALTRGGRLRMLSFPATLTPEQTTALVARTLAGVPLARPRREAA
jgi:ATPase family associated with various cellular activities (AAA)